MKVNFTVQKILWSIEDLDKAIRRVIDLATQTRVYEARKVANGCASRLNSPDVIRLIAKCQVSHRTHLRLFEVIKLLRVNWTSHHDLKVLAKSLDDLDVWLSEFELSPFYSAADSTFELGSANTLQGRKLSVDGLEFAAGFSPMDGFYPEVTK